MRAATVVVGPEGHGVVRHALLVAGAAGLPVVRCPHVPTTLPTADVVLVPFADGLYGRSTEAAAAAFERMTDGPRPPLIAVLHDLPDGDESARSARRRTTYRRVAARSQLVVVASEHERASVVALGADRPVVVVPLPILDAPVVPVPGNGRSVGVLGFVYPGKGHELALRVCRDLPPDVRVIAGGAPSEGHGRLVDELAAQAGRYGRPFTVTGPLDEAGLRDFIASTTVPLVPAQAPSASMSLGTWIGGGRRPLVVASPYACETAATLPGLIDVVDAASLPAALARRVGAPARSWRTRSVPDGVGLAAVAATFERLLAGPA